MLGSTISIENMSHLTSSFLTKSDDSEMEEERTHPTQKRLRKIKLVILFVIGGEDTGDDYMEEDQDPAYLPRLASIRVPKGVPVAKIRALIRHVEAQLQDIFGKSRRVNFVMMCEENSENWTYEFELPTFGVVYV